MCGIVGFFGQFNPDLLEKMNRSISHRGPDDQGTYYNPAKGLGLAHRRLSIIDLSPLGHQPMWDANQKVVIVFNGEIYNYRELRSELIASGYEFKSHSDTEVLLNLYLRDGDKMFSLLNGIYAFAIWDSRDESLLLARDGVGVKPLYYSETSKGLLFASELKALLQEESVDRSLNLEAIQYYLTYLWAPAPHTMLKSVKKLEPGHAMVVKNGRIQRQWQFYDLPYHQPIKSISENDAVNQLQEKLKQAVERQMVADVPVGAFLSGGLDSSSVVAFAKQAVPDQKIQCFTIGFKDNTALEEGMIDDLPYANQVARHLGVDLHTIYADSGIIHQLEKVIYHLDEPEADPASIHTMLISQLARSHGIKVLLSGTGGDDVFSGYRRHYALMQERYWSWMPKFARSGLKSLSSSLPLNIPLSRRMARAFQYADLEGDERLASYFYWTDPENQQSLYSESLREALQTVPSDPLVSSLSRLPGHVPDLNKMLYLEGKHFLADHNLNYADKMSMAAGVEVRVPLLDPELIAFGASLPVSYKQRGRVGKWIFKKAMEPYLPRDVIYRPKTGFGAPLRYWLKHELSPMVEDLLSETSLKKRGLFDPQGVKNFLDEDRGGRIDGAYTIFALICIELWCRIFIDSHP
jgi:asparagine synthase (glutamine-hydrolysing)